MYKFLCIKKIKVSEVSEPITSPTKKFQRTPRHSDVFDLEASPQVCSIYKEDIFLVVV